MSLATVAQFRASRDEKSLAELSSDSGESVDEVVLQCALDDATAEIEGLELGIAESVRPSAATKRVFCIKVAMYHLTLKRPARDLEQIRKAYDDVVAFYRRLADNQDKAREPLSPLAEAPPAVFTDHAMRGYVR